MISLPYEVTESRAPQLGLIALQSDETIEMDMHRLLPGPVELLVTRVPSGAHVTETTLAAMEGALCGAASLFPEGARLAGVGYGCTSGTAQIGATAVATAIGKGVRTPFVSEPVSALIAACRHLGVQRLVLVSPYIAPVSKRLIDVLGKAGITVTGFGSFEESEEEKVARITGKSIREGARAVAADAGMDALFLSCTNLRTLDVIADIEADSGLPVLSSNQVLAWHMLRCAGIGAPGSAPGRLWKIS